MDNLIEIKNLVKKYGNKVVLNGINAEFKSGKIIAIVGENGSGKTTLFKILLDLTMKTQGEINTKEDIFINGIIETPRFFNNMTGYENIKALSYKANIDRDKLIKIAKDFNIESSLSLQVKKYSLGMKRKLALVHIFLSNSDVILLDEPTNAIDIEALVVLKKYLLDLKQQGKLILIASHDYKYLRSFVDTIYEIKDGILNSVLNDCESIIESHLFELIDMTKALQIAKNNNFFYKAKENEILIIDEENIKVEDIFKLFSECGIEKYTHYKNSELIINNFNLL